MRTDRDHLIALSLVPELGARRARRLTEGFGSLERLAAASAEALRRAGLNSPLAARVSAACRDEDGLRRELERAQRAGVAIITLADEGYPERLKTIIDPPLALYVRGALADADAVAVGIVGSRRASLYGLECAERLAYELSLRGITVVSGLALGIDGAAHQGALKASGRTLAVLGSGLGRLYPPEHASLAKSVAAQGAVLSEFPMETMPLPSHFPRRNRIISGLSLGIVVVEAARRSGALITADCALEQGREVFAVPGPMTSTTSQGAHELVKQGARLVTSVDDILEELRLVPAASKAAASDGEPPSALALAEPERRVVACLNRREPRDIETLAVESGLAMPELSSLLLQLELKQRVQQLPGKRFVRKDA